MDPVASGLTIFDTIRKGARIAKKLYDAPKELEELQVEVETVASVLKDVSLQTHDLRQTSDSVSTAVKNAQVCLLEILQVIQYELIKDVPQGPKARRTAWLRKVGKVHDLQENLTECRSNVILALGCDTAGIVRNSVMQLQDIQQIQDTVRQKMEDIDTNLHDLGFDRSKDHQALLAKLDSYEHRWDSFYKTLLEAQSHQYKDLQLGLACLMEALTLQASPDSRRLGSGIGSALPERTLCVVDDQRRLLTAVIGSTEKQAIQSTNTFRQTAEILSPHVLFFTSGLREWLTACSCSHIACRALPGAQLAALPTRVLDVGDGYAGIRLHESTPGEKAPYLTLSYCWGAVAPMVTTRSSLAARKTDIPWAIIPPVFQDAISLTIKLGFRYLWIDALCIIQDDVEDWKYESCMMSEVYGNASCCIAADASLSVSENLTTTNTQAGSPTTEDRLTHSSKEAHAIISKSVGRTPLQSRAWAFQETMLSPRIIHFLDDRLVCECSEGYTMPMTNGRHASQPLIQHPDILKRHLNSIRSPSSGPEQSLDDWWRLVEQYSRLKLSFESDKLIALSGLAERFRKSLGRYAAGLWPEHDFVNSLGWRPRATYERARTYCAPTWSWACLQRPVERPSMPEAAPIADILEYRVARIGYYGAVRSASLTIRGPCIEAEACCITCDKEQLLLELTSGICRTIIEADCFLITVRKVLCLKLTQDDQGNISALVLQPVSEIESTVVYERIGVMQLYRRRGEQHWFDNAKEQILTIH